MKNKRLQNIIAIPAALTLAGSAAFAQTSALSPDLSGAASKVDTAGTYLELNKHDGDIAYITPYLQLIAEIARENGEDIPKDFNAAKLISALGLDKLKATAISNTNLGDIWHNQIYIESDPSAGIFSLSGGQSSEFTIPKMSPVGTDIALELELDLSQLPTIARNLGASVGKQSEVEKELTKKIPELNNATVEELLKKAKAEFNLAIDFDPTSKLEITPTTKLDRPRLIARIDGLTWLWDIVGDNLIKEAGLPLGKSEKDGVITYAIPEEMKEMLQGYTPQLIVDKNKDQIWLVTSPEFLAKATTPGKQLADDPKFAATWKGLPTTGNSMAYISKDFLNTLQELYATADKEGLLNDDDFQKAKPLVDKFIKDVTKSENGFAFSIAKDATGIHLANKTPFPGKYGRYLQSLVPLFAGKEQHLDEFEDRIEEAQDAVE